MIQTPCKLDLVLELNHTYNSSKNKSTSNNEEKCIQKEKLYNNQKNKLTIDFTNFNKFKSIVFDLSSDEIMWLQTDHSSGFNLKLEVSNKFRLTEENYENYILTNGILGLLDLKANSQLRDYINFDTENLVFQIIEWNLLSIDNFIDCVYFDRKPIISLTEARNAQSVVAALQESIKTGQVANVHIRKETD